MTRMFAAAVAVVLGVWSPAAASPISILNGLSLTYRVDLSSGALVATVDANGLGPLTPGATDVPGSMPTWVFGSEGLELGIGQPAGSSDVSGLGVFATPTAFAAGSIFGMRATFAAPAGPHGAGNLWAVALFARTGGEALLVTDTTASATLQVRGDGVRLNVPGASVPANLPNVPQDVYDTLFPPVSDPGDIPMFTIEMLVDRATGFGEAALDVGDFQVTKTFTFAAFRADGGPAITAIGPALAITNAEGQEASVRVVDFEVFTPVPEPCSAVLGGAGILGLLVRRLHSHK